MPPSYLSTYAENSGLQPRDEARLDPSKLVRAKEDASADFAEKMKENPRLNLGRASSAYRRFRLLFNSVFAGLFPASNCRFTPTCSVYCETALHQYGFLKGSLKCIWRLLRCQPLSRGGYDPP
jgi:hypothetical protein